MALFLILYIGDDMQIHLNYFVNGYTITYIYRTYIEKNIYLFAKDYFRDLVLLCPTFKDINRALEFQII